ncbi:MAG: hypothetical protein CMK09_11145 [Ponticaulis sp.]|nr:hypothetical protein [Ponticaulis sp.]|tara:strand:+ start:64606 stop:65229 length:624 start_codon:yes stop_codon:yes gene_type:complete
MSGSFSVSGDFTASIDSQDDGRVLRYSFEWVGSPLSFGEAISLMDWEDGFVDFLSELISQSGFSGLVWECPPVTRATLSRQFEFVVIDTGKPYHPNPDPSSFRSYLEPLDGREGVSTFRNLGGDASLIIPSWVDGADYRDLLHFLKSASLTHKRLFWRSISDAIQSGLDDSPIWLSIAGSGEPWLHVRLDSQPKYYQHKPYRKEKPS